ncbi:MAG: hypothetical protein J3Q66DRAFT_354065 [Benniella sp.]|nr:MAG: hypothetical protein J3Q66DRAFT_354065 [Benniella sp.]
MTHLRESSQRSGGLEITELEPPNPLTTVPKPRSAGYNSHFVQNPGEIQETDGGSHPGKGSVLQSPPAIRRWRFRQDKFWYKGVEEISEKSTAVVIQSGEQVQLELPMDGIPVGNYGLVICASFDNIDLNDIERWILDVRPGDNGMLYALDISSSTVVEKDELIGFPKGKFGRFRIHSSVDHLVATRSQFVTMRLDCKDHIDSRPSFEIHYIELDTNILRFADTTSDYILFGERKPSHVIGVGPDEPEKPKPMQAFDISDNGDYAVTLYYSGTKAFIEAWDLKEAKSNNGASKPEILRHPYAQATITISELLAEGTLQWPVAIDINSTGVQVTICTVVGQPDPGIPFQVLRLPAIEDGSAPRELQQITTICDGQYFALASHHRINSANPNEKERFWVTDGRSFTVYDTNSKWSALYKLDMQYEPDILAAQTAMMSIHGRYFAWTDARGAISIWDFETGKLFSHVFIGTQGNSAFPVLSSDGSMIAVTRNNTIQIHDTRTGIKIGVFKKGLGNNRYFEVVFGKDYFMAYNPEAATISKPMKHNMRSLVRLRDMAIVKTIAIHEDYRFNYPQTGSDPVFTFCHGPNLNILKMGSILSPVEKSRSVPDRACVTKSLERFIISSDFRQRLQNDKGEKFILRSTVNVVHGQSMRMLHITIDNSEDGGINEEQSVRMFPEEDNGGRKTMSFPVGLNWCDYTGFFIPATSQLGVVMGVSLILWTLSATKPWMCKLALMWRIQDKHPALEVDDVCIREIISAESCVHGKQIKLRLTAPLWYRMTFDITEEVSKVCGYEGEGTLTIPMSSEDTIFTREERSSNNSDNRQRDFRAIQERRVDQGIADLIDVYLGGNDQCQDAIIQYLRSHIRPSDENRISSLVSLCKAWKPRLRKQIELLLRILLPSDRITWVPLNHATKETNPLAIILGAEQQQFSALGAARIIMDYCVEHANRSRNLAFLAPFFGCLRVIMTLYPDEAFRYLCRIAFIPVMHRSYLLDNCIVVVPPSLRWKFWKSGPVPLYKMKDHIFQLRVSSKEPDPNKEKFTNPVFMASFDALWHYRDQETPESRKNGPTVGKTTWKKSLMHMILLKTKLKSRAYVEAFNFSIEFYDNPAIAALVAYKWNTIGYWYWFVRFLFQGCFYMMVVTAAFMQVYWDHPSRLSGLFWAIIVMAIVFLWLELRQAVGSFKRYRTSGYNILDVLAFSLPLAASIRQLTMIHREDGQGNSQILSFSVLAVFLHMLFELRIYKSVCKFVTIIQQAVTEIRVFFVIFAGGILAFAIATLHLLHACAYDGCVRPETTFPDNFLRAMSSVYFFMGGRWDPVSENFDSDNVGFHMMMVLFFFTSVVLMLNVLIALINVAFNKGDDGWRLAWIESRLRYIEAAENMSYHIPGFRQTYDFFPNEIYFSVTPTQVQEINWKLDARDFFIMDLDMTEKWLKEGNDEDDALEANDGDVDILDCHGEVDSDDETEEQESVEREEAAEVEKGKGQNSNMDHGIGDDGNVELSSKPVENLTIADHPKITDHTEVQGSSSGGSKIESRKGKEKSVPTMEATPPTQQGSQDHELISRLNKQVNDLHQEVANLQRQMTTQQERAEKQFNELKRLLLHIPAR